LADIDWKHIAGHIGEAVGSDVTITDTRSVGGGCINAAWQIGDGDRAWFVKLNAPSALDMFVAEAEALQTIAGSGTLTVPLPVCYGSAGRHSFLVLEYLALTHRSADDGQALGARLAAMHRQSAARFGWYRDNTIGSTPQDNTETVDWSGFWKERRLGFQLELAARNGFAGRLQQRGRLLLDHVDELLAGHEPPPSLLHGDLWSGNYAYTTTGQPVIFDPALYFGDRETDIAMTELFGGFAAGFYQAYQDAWPLDAGYAQRKILYNLYHVLNHVNLFGGAYLSQAEAMIEDLLRG
jgi:fructosamine-3-kinase